MNNIFPYIFARLAEPSTMAGIGLVVGAFQRRDWAGAFEAGLGTLAIIVPESWRPTK